MTDTVTDWKDRVAYWRDRAERAERKLAICEAAKQIGGARRLEQAELEQAERERDDYREALRQIRDGFDGDEFQDAADAYDQHRDIAREALTKYEQAQK